MREARPYDAARAARGTGASRSSDSGSTGRNAFPDVLRRPVAVFRPSPSPLRVSSGFAPDSLTHQVGSTGLRKLPQGHRPAGGRAATAPLPRPSGRHFHSRLSSSA
ncbi:hypothetical protein GCM10010330_28610 [Streptomyces tendae]|nr:hypothetical protein GCM10010330_28610 [Streptomyces tendae]